MTDEGSGRPEGAGAEVGGWPATVVITNHNYARFVGAAIDSVLAQTVRCRLVVVDDGSSDDSPFVIAHRLGFTAPPTSGLVTADDGSAIVVLQANGGQASAFNAGWAAIVEADGQQRGGVDPDHVVFFLDGDDELSPRAVARVTRSLAHQPDAGRCQFRMGFIDGDGRPRPGGLPEPGRPLPVGDLVPAMMTNPDDVAWQPTSGNAFRASVLAALLPMSTEPYRISADHYLSNLSALYGPVVAVEEELARYRVHGANADHRARFDLDRIRSILVRTGETRAHLIDHARRRGFDPPSDGAGFRSLTTAALTLVSSRFPDHPADQPGRWTALARTVAAARGRTDFSTGRRLGALVWAVAVAVAPRGLVPWLSARALTR